jgi:hypothetical protein
VISPQRLVQGDAGAAARKFLGLMRRSSEISPSAIVAKYELSPAARRTAIGVHYGDQDRGELSRLIALLSDSPRDPWWRL